MVNRVWLFCLFFTSYYLVSLLITYSEKRQFRTDIYHTGASLLQLNVKHCSGDYRQIENTFMFRWQWYEFICLYYCRTLCYSLSLLFCSKYTTYSSDFFKRDLKYWLLSVSSLVLNLVTKVDTVILDLQQ